MGDTQPQLPPIATPKFDFTTLPNLDEAFVTTPTFSPPTSLPKIPSVSVTLQPHPVPQLNVPTTPPPLRKSLERTLVRPTTPIHPVLHFPEVQEPTDVFSEELQEVEPSWQLTEEVLPIAEVHEEPKGPSLEERLEEYLAAKRHNLMSRAFNVWREWAFVRSNERKSIEKAARRALRTRPMRLISPKPMTIETNIDYDYYVNTQQRQEAFQQILASLRQRVSFLTLLGNNF